MYTYNSISYYPDTLSTFKSRDNVPLTCNYCNCQYLKTKHRIQSDLKKSNLNFCSLKCKGSHRKAQRPKIACKECNTVFETLRKRISEYNFCSKSCSVTYTNKNKTYGIRRSKLEHWLEANLTRLYPDLQILYSYKLEIGSELDIFIPSKNVGFEINGIVHYEPIYGEYKFNQIKFNDESKISACKSKGINLIIIDVSRQKNFTIKHSEEILSTIELHLK